ncbi:MAG: hypothetical protein E5Y73_09725 [Mesorhizobium sp.]|uniref:hypothetical protein n=1 Tax=Mesorhizobium sp. TaxID=1871066 RepID=UPI0012074A56|nr:hypothetical protein [Mesorhizobium sp.]TIL94803.1 MAG: hypothetical protein E5Y73_09725 [Mesorhizobium sp.]
MANEVAAAFSTAWRDYVIDGVPSSGANKPLKSEIRGIGPIVDAQFVLVREEIAAVEADTVAAVEAITDPLSERVDDVEALALSGVKPPKQSVRLLMTTNVDIAAACENGDTLDALVLVTGDRFALTGQTAPAQNGVYIVPASGAAARSTDMDTADEIVGGRFDVDAGTHAGETWAVQTLAPITVGTTALVIVRTTTASALAGVVADLETEVEAIAESVSGGDNAGVSAVIEVGGSVVASVTLDGQFRFMVPLHEDDMPGASSGSDTAYADGSRYLVSPNEMWSQWVWPRTTEDDDGNQIWGSLGKQEGPLVDSGSGLVGRPGPLWIGYRERYAANAKKVLIGYSEESSGLYAARGSQDDHNRASHLRHPNPSAPIRLVAFQSDHSAIQWSRFWRSTTLNPEDLTLVGQTPTVPGEYHSYGQLWWNGASLNELRGCYRIGDFDSGVWAFFKCDPAGTMASWTHYKNKIGGDGTYFIAAPTEDNSGRWIASVRHPTVAGDKKITLAKLLWDWSLVAGDGTVISADITAEVTPIDILNDADVTVIATATGDRRLRLFDAREYDDGLVRFLYADFPTVGITSITGDYKIAIYNPATDVTTIETVCGCGGKIQEEVSLDGEYVAGAGTSSYVAGACLTDRPTEIVAARWWSTYGDLVLCSRQGVDDWELTEIDRAAGKIFRPEGHARQYWESSTVKEALTSRVSYLRGSGARGGYAMFYNTNADRVTVDLAAFRSTFL